MSNSLGAIALDKGKQQRPHIMPYSTLFTGKSTPEERKAAKDIEGMQNLFNLT